MRGRGEIILQIRYNTRPRRKLMRNKVQPELEVQKWVNKSMQLHSPSFRIFYLTPHLHVDTRSVWSYRGGYLRYPIISNVEVKLFVKLVFLHGKQLPSLYHKIALSKSVKRHTVTCDQEAVCKSTLPGIDPPAARFHLIPMCIQGLRGSHSA